jgi:geranylgeranyl reductase family protein
MIRCDALVVGGGPAGSTCARLLRRAGWHVVVADRAAFPRDKVCAGWLTPDVFPLLDLTPSEYRASGLTLQEITGFRTSVLGPHERPHTRARPPMRTVETGYASVISYAIRRCEFDEFLLRRARVPVLERTDVARFSRNGDRWVVNDAIEARVIVGAGGHFCPVARHLRGAGGAAGGADAVQAVVAKEAEVRIDGHTSGVQPDRPALFFCRDLEGYGWCVRKGDYVNVGIGRRAKEDFGTHVDQFAALLEHTGALSGASTLRWKGHAYLAGGTGPRPLTGDGVLVAGDAAGLAYPESGEGIKPAIESGRLAAEALIAAGGLVGRPALAPYEAELRRRYPPASRSPKALRGTIAALGRALLGSPAFTRHVVIDRWFLRT